MARNTKDMHCPLTLVAGPAKNCLGGSCMWYRGTEPYGICAVSDMCGWMDDVKKELGRLVAVFESQANGHE